LILGAIVLFAATVVVAVNTHAGENPTKLRIIYSNDMLGYVEPCG
jgi:hypothetical protein